MKKQLFTAIIFTEDGKFLKYRNIPNHDKIGDKFYNTGFMAFAISKGAKTINFYEKESKKFFEQIKISTT